MAANPFDRTIVAPSGPYKGRWPDTNPGRLLEHRLSTELAIKVDGAVELRLRCGRADVANTTDIFEVEPLVAWTHGLQQVFAYAFETGLYPNLAVFGDSPSGVVDIYLVMRDELKMRAALWAHNGYHWFPIQSRDAARRKLTLKTLDQFEEEGNRRLSELQTT